MSQEILSALAIILSAKTIFWATLGMALGIVVGAIPGLTATMTIALLLSITYGMDTVNALAVLIPVYLGGIYGGSRSAILLNVPGTVSSACTAVEGFPLAKKGQGDLASLVATSGSMIGGLIGVIVLAVASPIIASAALKIAAWEFFWLGMFGIIIAANMSEGKLGKGLLVGMLGLLLTTIGIDPVFGDLRLTFGSRQLVGGINMLPAMIGLFGIGEAFCALSENIGTEMILDDDTKKTSIFSDLKESFKIIAKRPRNLLTSSFIGTFIGAVPGVGPDIASWVSYDVEKRNNAKEKDQFGKGWMSGLMASEVANNAATSGVFIPLITLGIPGCACSAVILGGMRLHGLRPGPTFFLDQKEWVYFIVGILILSNILILFLGVLMTKPLGKLITIPYGIVMPLVCVFSTVGAFAMSYRWFDIVIMFCFGLLGYFLRKGDFPTSPLVLSLILGNIIETNFRRGLIAGSISDFFTRPICLGMILTMVVLIGFPFLKKWRNKTNNNNSN